MTNYYIGLSGINAAQRALDIIGNNIANAATEGYHRQRVNFSPAYSSHQGSVMIGGGVDIDSITRVIDDLLEQEILRQCSSLNQVSQEYTTLRTIENAFGEFLTEEGGLSAAIDNFFNALQNLSIDPADTIWQNQAVTDAENMANQFRILADFLTTSDRQIRLEAENIIESVNTLTNQIAELNNSIAKQEISGNQTNSLCDQRDKLISDLAELIGTQTLSREFGVVDVNVGGIPVVTNTSSTNLEVGLDENGNMGISIAGESNYTTSLEGGKIGALLSLKNETVADIRDKLDSLAKAIIQQINQYHVQGVGTAGSFTSLTGWTNASEDLSAFSSISDGSICIRVKNTSTGAITRTEIFIDSDDDDTGLDTLSDVADAISGITGLTALVNSSNQLTILTTDTNYQFDFLPAVLPEPDPIPILTGDEPPDIAVSGIYTGTTNSTYVCTVAGVSGQIGVTDGLKLQVTKDGTLTKELNVGLGYVSGNRLELGDGLYISLSIDDGKTAGDLNVNDSFEIKAWADTDTSGLLAAIGINTFFSGSSASDFAVCSDISANIGRVATSIGPDMDDNTNAARMAQVKDLAISDLGSLTCGQYYQRLVADIGQKISVKQIRQDNLEVMIQNLTNQQNETSGVDINEEAAQLLIFEQMFQAMAKYLNSVQSSINSILQIIG